MWLFKALGLVLIFSVCTLWGFSAAAKIEKRTEKLGLFSRSVSNLAERIRTDSGEINRLLSLCFKEELLIFSDNGFSLNESSLKTEDISVLEEFLSGLGRGDITAEYNRTKGFACLLENRHIEAKEESGSLCRLYRKLGSLVGIFICIFFL